MPTKAEKLARLRAAHAAFAQQTSNTRDKTYPCANCNQIFYTKRALAAHQRSEQ